MAGPMGETRNIYISLVGKRLESGHLRWKKRGDDNIKMDVRELPYVMRVEGGLKLLTIIFNCVALVV
jgi:hypothetical protein